MPGDIREVDEAEGRRTTCTNDDGTKTDMWSAALESDDPVHVVACSEWP